MSMAIRFFSGLLQKRYQMTADEAVLRGETPVRGAPAESAAVRRAERLLRGTLNVLVVVLLVVAGRRWLLDIAGMLGNPAQGLDFTCYYAAALALRDNHAANIYDLHVIQSAALAHGVTARVVAYVYPPFIAVLLIPATFLSLSTATTLWAICNLALWIATLALLLSLARTLLSAEDRSDSALVRMLVSRNTRWLLYGLVIFLGLTFEPLGQGVGLGQMSMAVLFLTVLAAWLAQRGNDRLAGVALALASWIKIYPLLLVVYFFARRRAGIWQSALVTLGVTALAMLPILGVDGLLATRLVFTSGGSITQATQNEALARVPTWLAVLFGAQPSAITAALGFGLIALVVGAFCFGVYRAWRSERGAGSESAQSTAETTLLGYLWALCTMTLVAPIVWEHSYAWVLPPILLGFVYLLVHPTAGRSRSALLIAAIVLAYVFTTADFPFGFDGNTEFTIGPYLFGQPLRPYFMLLRPLGALLAWGVCGYLYLTRTLVIGAQSSMSARFAAPTTRRLAVLVFALLAAVMLMRGIVTVLVLSIADPIANMLR